MSLELDKNSMVYSRFQSPIMVWYTTSKENRMLSQLMDISLSGLSLHSSYPYEKDEEISAELQFPTSYPKLTSITGKILKSNEEISNTLYLLHIQFYELETEAKAELDNFIHHISKKEESSKTKPVSDTQKKPPTPAYAPSPELNLNDLSLSIEESVHLFTILGDPQKIGRNKFICNIKGALQEASSESDYILNIRTMGPTGLVFVSEERLILKSKIKLFIPFPTNKKDISGEFKFINKLAESIIPVQICKRNNPDEANVFLYEADYLTIEKSYLHQLHKWLIHLMIKILGKELVLTAMKQYSKPDKDLSNKSSTLPEEHRQSKRIKTDLPATLFNEIDFQQGDGKIADISKNGAKFLTEQFFRPNDRLVFKITLPETKEVIRLSSIVRWNHFIEKKNFYEIGIQFDFMNTEESNALDSFIQKLKK